MTRKLTKAERVEQERARKRESDWVDYASSLACYLRADAMRDYLDHIIKKFAAPDRLTEHRWVGASAMFYASMCPLIEAWEKRLKPKLKRADARVDALLASPLRNIVFDFRNNVLHFDRYNDKRVLELLRNNADVEIWSREFHRAIGEHLSAWREELVAALAASRAT